MAEKEISNIIKLGEGENIISSYPIYDFNIDSFITIFTHDGMVKRTKLSDFKIQRYSKPITCMKLKDADKVVSVCMSSENNVFISTFNGYGLRYKLEEIPVVGLKASGVKAINLKNDYVVNGEVFDQNHYDYLTLITNKNTVKRIHLNQFDYISRAKKGVQIIREVKTNPYNVLKTFITNNKDSLGIKTRDDILLFKMTEIPILDRYSTGTVICKGNIVDVFKNFKVITKETKLDSEMVDNKTNTTLDNIDNQIMTIDDFLDDFKI